MRISPDVVLDLFDHTESADAMVWSAALRHPAAAADADLRRQLLHISSVQMAFLDAWKGRPFKFRDHHDVPLEGELAAVQAYYPEARAFIAGLDDADLAASLRLPWAGWIERHWNTTLEATTLGETILQVLSHGTHHRAQANSRLRAVGVEPPMVDYIAWVWRGRPQPEWPAAPQPA